MAVVLTEGITADILKGNPSKIIQMYVCSPLIWGIYAPLHYKTIEETKNTKVAISRFGSGSHLMALLDAKERNWDIQNCEFKTTNGLKGAIQVLTEATCGRFLWEKFMTKPYVDKGLIQCLGEYPTPWGAFVIAVRENILEKNLLAVQKICEIITKLCQEFVMLKDVTQKISQKFNLLEEDVKKWLESVHFAQKYVSPLPDVEKVLKSLVSIGQDTQNIQAKDLIFLID
jgi:hypothetical protein